MQELQRISAERGVMAELAQSEGFFDDFDPFKNKDPFKNNDPFKNKDPFAKDDDEDEPESPEPKEDSP